MKWNLSLPEPRMLVYYYVKLMGLAPFTLKKNKFHTPTLLNMLYAVLFAIAYFTVVAIEFTGVLKKFNRPDNSLLSNFGDLIQYFVGFASTFSTLWISLFMHKRIILIMNKLRTIGKEVRSLGIKEDLKEFFKNLFLTIVMSNAVLIATCATLSFIDPNLTVGLWIEYSIGTWLHFNTVLIFVQILLFVKQRFKLLNEKLYDVFRPAVRLAFLCELATSNQEDIEDLTDRQRIHKIEELQLELTELVDQTTDIFTIPILLNSLKFYIEITVSCLRIYVVLRDSTEIRSAAEFIYVAICIACSLVRMIIAMVAVLFIAHESGKICEEDNATKAVLSEIWYKFKPRKLEHEFYMFALQLLHKPAAVPASKLSDPLVHSLLYTILCAVVAYVIVMIDLDTPQPSSGI